MLWMLLDNTFYIKTFIRYNRAKELKKVEKRRIM